MIGPKRRAWVPLALLLAVILLSGTKAAAQGDERKVGLLSSSGTLKATFSYRDLFTQKVRKKMTSGLTVRVVVQIALENAKGKTVGYWAQSVEIAYDLWEEDFSIAVQDSSGRRRTRVATIEEAVNVSGILWRAPIETNISSLPPGVYRLRVLAEANPVSEEMVKNIQRWIARPKGGHGESEARSNFFGSFVGYFVDRGIGRADRTVGFHSQWFRLGPE